MDVQIPQSPKPYLTIRPTSGWQAVNFRELWLYRDLFWTMAVRDVKLRYKQTALGVIWIILQPIISAGVFTFVFGKVAKMPSDGLPYFIFSYAGLMGWNIFSTTVSKASGSLVGNGHLVSKVYFPRLILPFYMVLGTLQDFAVSFCVFLVAMLLHGVTPGWPILLVPVFILLMLVAGMGIGLISAGLMVHYRDVATMLNFVIQFVMYVSPVVYSASAVPANLRGLYFANPMSALIEGFRWCVLNRGEIHPWSIIYAASISFMIFVVGLMVFRRMEKKFADVI